MLLHNIHHFGYIISQLGMRGIMASQVVRPKRVFHTIRFGLFRSAHGQFVGCDPACQASTHNCHTHLIRVDHLARGS
jgi:hypothetical protein